MHLTFIRHGETPANVSNSIASLEIDMQISLTEHGIEQAKQTGDLLKNQRFDAIFVSDMHRTQQTASNVFPNRKDFILDARLRESCVGKKPGVVYFYDEIGKEKRVQMRLDGFPDGGESFQQQIDRVQDFLQEVAKKPYQNIAIVTHGGSIRALYVIAGKSSLSEALYADLIKNCGIIQAQLDENGKLSLEIE